MMDLRIQLVRRAIQRDFSRDLNIEDLARATNLSISYLSHLFKSEIGCRNTGEDAVTEKGGLVFLPQAVETFTHDDDGNLTSDGRWNYTWDAENRLVSMEAIASVPPEAKQRLEFSYDYMARRVQKKVYVWNPATSSYQLQSTLKFVYEGGFVRRTRWFQCTRKKLGDKTSAEPCKVREESAGC